MSMSRIFRRFYQIRANEYTISKNLKPLSYGSDSVQYKVLKNALDKHVPEHGFNERAIVSSLNDFGYSSCVLSGIGTFNSPSVLNVSTSVLELVKFNLVTKRYDLINNLTPDSSESLDDLETLFLRRLEMNKPIAPHLSQLLSILAIPGDFLVNFALPELHQLTDDMVFYSTEKDHNDFAWYSKRLAISTAYISTELFMSQDKSPDYQQTMEFAINKLKNVESLGNMYNNVEEYLWYTLLSSINLAKSQMSRG